MTKWEYSYVILQYHGKWEMTNNNGLEIKLLPEGYPEFRYNDMGNSGWELVTITPISSEKEKFTAVFKRLIK
jgi:predicted secreted protein